MSFSRTSGILLHPTSLPGRFGIGDIGYQSYRFVDFLAETKQQLWQILPLGPTGHGNSPYMSYSAMAGNPMLISLENVQSQGLLEEEELALIESFPIDRVDYGAVSAFKLPLLRKAAERFKEIASDETKAEFNKFRKERASWLEDYGLFMALRDTNDGKPWPEWEYGLVHRDPDALNFARVDLASEIFYHEYMQFEFYRQWHDLKSYANKKGIQIVGDMPIYVSHNSSDVWAFPDKFMLNTETMYPSQMAGVPPDFFSAEGQLWGNPTYNWTVVQEEGFGWWMLRIRSLLDFVDLMRIDHFRGFESYWAIPEGSSSALTGEWIEAPGYTFFEAVEEKLGKLPFLAEDLGMIDDKVHALRDHFGFPGMKILQFAFGSDDKNLYLPHNIDRNFVVYTGTHDNDTTVGWFTSATEYEKLRLVNYVGAFEASSVHWAMIRLAMSSVANQAVIQLQDILGLGTQSRMNTPGTAEGNWEWRYVDAMLTPTIAGQLRNLTELYGRAPSED
ncbi:MAG: 4-alpha-glucanotransferase [Cyanobacteria bacterium P01_F01_bin.3]